MTRKIRVLHLIKGLNWGGAETLLVEGQRFADQERFELSYGYFDPALDGFVPRLRSARVSVTCFGGDNPVSLLLRTRRVAQHLREQKIDLVHCHLPMVGVVGRIAGRMTGVPVVYTEHNKVEWYRRSTFWLNACTYEWQRQVIAVSESVRQSIVEYIGPNVPVTVVRNAIDLSRFERVAEIGASCRLRYGIPEDAPVVGNVAALIPQKRLYDWLVAADLIRRQHPGVHFFVIGEGPLGRELRERVASLSLQDVVHLPGAKIDVRPYLAATDVYMASSAYEGLPVSLLEAMAMRCAPVCTAVGGIPEVLTEGVDGFLTETGRPEQLAGRVGELLLDLGKCRAVGEAARRTVEAGFGIQRMVQEVEALYGFVLGQQEAGPVRESSQPRVALDSGIARKDDRTART